MVTHKFSNYACQVLDLNPLMYYNDEYIPQPTKRRIVYASTKSTHNL